MIMCCLSSNCLVPQSLHLVWFVATFRQEEEIFVDVRRQFGSFKHVVQDRRPVTMVWMLYFINYV
uniref:Uncharacterized protein n=1 Tax=Kalanchoe fedtschenkoi TaxID=63787 RepID=A0A7N0TMI7_KALFE